MSNLYAEFIPDSLPNLIVGVSSPDNLFLCDLSIEVCGLDSSLVQYTSMKCSHAEHANAAIDTIPSDLLFESLHFTFCFEILRYCIWERKAKAK